MAVPGLGDILAPDGIIIRAISGAQSELTSVVLGIIPPRPEPYLAHRHLALEQVTYVLRGPLSVRWRGPEEGTANQRTLETGEAITTLPTTCLAFCNGGPHTAEVLFICVPPYPVTDCDTELPLSIDTPIDAESLVRAMERHRLAAEYLSVVVDARLKSLRWRLPA